VCVNIMAASHVLEPDLDEALGQLAETDFEAIYLVDSFGAFYSEDIECLAEKYLAALEGKTLGIHCHNNQQLAFANTISAIISGANFLDGSLYGIGRGAGNCPLELLVAFLKNPKFRVRPLIDAIETQILPWREKIDWGYFVPYMATGVLNQHPRAAMALMESEDKNKITAFYDKLNSPSELV